MNTQVVVCLLLALSSAFADHYMHNPRGSNDRLNEANTNRNNANRLFDSQNNAKGGYCYGPAMYYYEGSQLTVEWTSQHGCGNPKLECNIVLQYLCGEADSDESIRIRDGTTTNTIPNDVNPYNQKNENGEFVFGMHEPFSYYQACSTRDRNLGLFIADRESEGNLNAGRKAAIFTRQNNNGNRHGFECTEERDYWPYWHPSPWKDIAVLTDDTSLCDFFKSESQNVKEKGECVLDGVAQQPNNEAECTQKGFKWVMQPSHGIPAPDCVKNEYNRDNHLGNGGSPGALTSHYNWTLPVSSDEPCIKNEAGCNCVLRMRYNISTTDLDGWGFDDYTKNAANSPVTEDPIVDFAGHQFQLAIDTSQFGRTFQDRSFVFSIKPRPDDIPSSARIYNLNVRGKRGNIVQTYPSTEYDFVPEALAVKKNDYIHFQWTGCDTNPAGNAGEGTDQTDRHNIVQVASLGDSYPASEAWLKDNTPMISDEKLRARFANIDQTNCLSQEELLAKNNNNENQAKQDVQNCFKLNAAPTGYFDGGVVKAKDTGVFHFMSTRNNNFSNRGQKATLYVSNLLANWAVGIVVAGAVLFGGSVGVAGAMFYSKANPHSAIARVLNKF